MSQVIIAAAVVNSDTPSTSIVEMNLVRPDHPEQHRYQILTVIRDGKEEQLWTDMGLAKNWNRPQFRIITGGKDEDGKLWSEHTAGEARDLANHLREGPFEQPEPPKEYQPGQLQQAWQDQGDIHRKKRKGLSSFGRGGVVVRG